VWHLQHFRDYRWFFEQRLRLFEGFCGIVYLTHAVDLARRGGVPKDKRAPQHGSAVALPSRRPKTVARGDPRADLDQPRGPAHVFETNLRSETSYDGQGAVCCCPGDRLTRITFISSSLSAGFWKNAAAPAFKARSSLL
jgi:hypothetical protein